MTDQTPIIERRASPGIDMERLEQHIAKAIGTALRETAKDAEFSQAFWRRGFEELTKHSSNGASQWVGKRLLTIAITAVTSAGIIWLVKSGGIK